MSLLCFDVDGTLVPGLGPIPIQHLEDLAQQGHLVVIVSPSPLRPKGAPFPEFLSVDRKKNLLDARAAHPHSHAVYISDNDGDDHLCTEVDFEYVHPDFWANFRAKLEARKG
ncbi:MAG: hypothetical protein O3B84_02670 [Chloroflexi bacterium]|nr:hypothetical protein [Chloroflexota bacterium]